MKLYSLELVLFGWLAYNIFVEIHDWVAESFEDNYLSANRVLVHLGRGQAQWSKIKERT